MNVGFVGLGDQGAPMAQMIQHLGQHPVYLGWVMLNEKHYGFVFQGVQTTVLITWASRTRLRLASSLAAAAALRHLPLKVLRIGVHPPDVHHPALVRSIARTFATARRNRRPAAYRDLLG